jgi:capsular polysaccharide transport system permease protein
MQIGVKPPVAGEQRPTPVDAANSQEVSSPARARPPAPIDVLATPTTKAGSLWRKPLMFLLKLSPTIVIGLYMGFVAADRYVSEAAFVVRSASKPTGASGFGALLQITGISRNDDTYSVNEFLVSRDAVTQLQSRLPLAEMYGAKGADFLSRYPSVIFGPTTEQLYKYFSYMSEVNFNSLTGVTTLRVQAFRPEDARAINSTLLDLSERLINQLNERIRQDTVRVYEQQVALEQQRLVDDQVAIVAFQNKELTIDPKTNSLAVSQLLGRLGGDLAQAQTRITATKSSSPDNPTLPVMRGQAAATASQIAVERARIGDGSDGLADKLGQFTRLDMERSFAIAALSTANAALDNAKLEAQRKQLYLDRIVEPNMADYAIRPQRIWITSTALLLNLLALMMIWMIRSGVREHGSIGS